MRVSVRSALLTVICIALYSQLSSERGLSRVLEFKSDNFSESTFTTPSLGSQGQAAMDARQGLYVPSQPDMFTSDTILRLIKGAPNHFLSDCVPTAQYQVETSTTSWILHSLDHKGIRKTHGGDEIYVTYRDQTNNSISPNAIARIKDLRDGSYKLNFVKSRSPELKDNQSLLSGMGSITIYLHYTCFAGHLDPPLKNLWTESGLVNSKYTSVDTILAPPIKVSKMPKQFPELASYDRIYSIGNSLMQNFCMKKSGGDGEGRKPNLHQPAGVSAPLNTQTVYEDFIPRAKQLHIHFENTLTRGTRRTKKIKAKAKPTSALILGSCVWDTQAQHNKESYNGHKFGWFEIEDHLEALEILVKTIRKDYPNWKLYWKGCTAMQIHAIPFQGSYAPSKTPIFLESIWYASWIRGQILDVRQKKLLKKLRVPVLDLWSLSFDMAELLQYKDIRHYNDIFNQFAVDYFYSDMPIKN